MSSDSDDNLEDFGITSAEKKQRLLTAHQNNTILSTKHCHHYYLEHREYRYVNNFCSELVNWYIKFGVSYRMKGGILSLRCTTVGCLGRARLGLDGIVQLKSECRGHLANPVRIKRRAAVQEAKVQRLLGSTTRQAVNGVRQTVSNEALAILPLPRAFERIVQRVVGTSAETNQPVPAVNWDDFTVEGETIRVWDKSEEVDENEIIILVGGHEWMLSMESSNHWFCDGDMKRAPQSFSQMYVIGAEVLGRFRPCLFEFLKNREQTTYTNLFRKVRSYINKVPDKVTLDFEKAACNSIKEIYPEAELSLCYFHFVKAVSKQIEKKGLSLIYSQNELIRKYVKALLSLSFLGKNKVEKDFISLSEHAPAELTDFFIYFHRTYIGGNINGRNVAPRYAINDWNQHGNIMNGQVITNNYCESFNSIMQRWQPSKNPLLSVVMRKIIQYDESRISKDRQLLLRNLLHPDNHQKPYKHQNLREAIQRGQGAKDLVDYLWCLSNNIGFTSSL